MIDTIVDCKGAKAMSDGRIIQAVQEVYDEITRVNSSQNNKNFFLSQFFLTPMIFISSSKLAPVFKKTS